MTQTNTSVRFFVGLLTLVFSVFVFSAAMAEEKKKTEPSKEQESTGAFGMKAGSDPDGALRAPTKAEENKLNAELNKTLSKYSKHNAKHSPDGTLSLVVAPHGFQATVAHIGPDGKVHMSCTDAGHTNNHTEELPEE